MLVEQGMSRNAAALALGLGGVGQVAGRLGVRPVRGRHLGHRPRRHRPGRRRGRHRRAGAGTAALRGLLIVLGMVLGLARGIYTLVQATAVTDRWGPASYGTLNGILTAPALVAAAVAPFAGAALAQLLGSYADAFLVLAGVAGVAALLMLGATPVDRRRRRVDAVSEGQRSSSTEGGSSMSGTSSTSRFRTRRVEVGDDRRGRSPRPGRRGRRPASRRTSRRGRRGTPRRSRG